MDIVVQAFVLFLLTKQDFLSIKIDQVRFRGGSKTETVYCLLNPNLIPSPGLAIVNINEGGYPENFSCGLCLLYNHSCLLCCFIVFVLDIEFWMAIAKIPLVEIPGKVHPTNLFKSQAQMMGFSRLEFIAAQVKIQSLEKRTVSNMFSQHVQDPSAFLIADGVKHLLPVFIIKPHKVFFGIVTHQVPLHTAEIFSITSILTILVFIPKGLTIVSKGFIEGKVAPAFGSYIIAKPLVKQFVCNGAFPYISIGQFSCILLGGFLVDGSCGILHGTGYIFPSRDLTVLDPGVFNAGNFGEIGHHFWCVAKDFLGHRSEFLFNIIIHFLSLP